MRGFGVTAVDWALECQMDKLAHVVGIDPAEFRIINAYRDGDMKAHRREAKGTALIECVQVATEKAKWKIGDEYRRAESRKGGGGERAIVPPTPKDAGPLKRISGAAISHSPTFTPVPAQSAQPTTFQERFVPPQIPAAPVAPPAAQPASTTPQLPPAGPAAPGTKPSAPRFSSVFGTRRR
jgi:hypothetical protein